MAEHSDPSARPAILRRHIFAAVVGNALEFYDFTTYAYFATQIGQLQLTVDRPMLVREVLSVARDAETGQRGFLLTGDVQYLQPYYAAIASLSDRMGKLRSKLSGDPAAARQFDDLQRLIRAKTDELTSTIDVDQGGSHAAA